MKIQITNHGDKAYAYACTSKRVKGKDNPVMVRRYIGILDPETGLVTPKKVPPETFLAQIHDDEFTCLDLGNILIARSIAESLRVPEYLERIFGERSKVVYALVLAIAVNQIYSSDYMDYVNGYHLEDVIGKGRLTAGDIDDALGDFHNRVQDIVTDLANHENRYVFVIDDVTTEDIIGRRASSYGGNDRAVSSRMFFIITDDSGNPLILRSSSAGASIGESFRVAIRRAERAGGTNTFVLNRRVSSGTLFTLANNGVHFMANMDHLLDDVRLFRQLTGGMANLWRERTLDSRRYYVLEIELGILPGDDGHPRLVFGRTGELRDATLVLRASIWYDFDEYDRLAKELAQVTRRRVEALEAMTIDSAMDHLRDGSIESSFISVSEREDGSVKASISCKARREAAMLSSIHIAVSDRLSWDECIRCNDMERSIASHARPIASVAVDRKPRSGYSFLFLAFIAMRIRMALEKRVQEAGLGKMSAERVFPIASSYRVVRVNGYTYRSSIPKNAERLFDALGVDTNIPLTGGDRSM